MSYVKLPPKIEKLNLLAHNLWWSWNDEAIRLFEKINPEVYAQTRSPVMVLHKTQESVFESFSSDKDFVKSVETVYASLEKYLQNTKTWYAENFPQKNEKIVYFSAEYGIHESLPIYSGGLGVLSGDHVKSTSDLGLPGVFVGLFYRDGYFIQQIGKDGQQHDLYQKHEPHLLGVLPVFDKDGKALEISVDLAGREVFARVYKATVGRVELYLLDSNVEKNGEVDRELTARLYGGDREMRISQEIILGIGGIRMLEKLGIQGSVFHMNEGHSGFFQLERIRSLVVKNDLSFEEAKILCASNCVFTTHTPVPAGNEAFALPLMQKYFLSYIQDLKISWDQFLRLGMVNDGSDNKYFSLTVFAINFSRFQNGVSELHGRIAKRMWSDLWSEVPEIDNSITHITNGIHVETWTCPEVKSYLTKCFGEEWKEKDADPSYWNKVYELPLSEIRNVKKVRKTKMISLVRSRLEEQLKRNGASDKELHDVKNYLKDDVLTVGFARRFATYKRATLIFKDLKRLEAIVNNPRCPVQFIFAGKAHPQDKMGQKYIKEIYEISRKPPFLGKIIILENYDMNISSHLVSGVDVWLNNPRRPMEASGTSGQKVPVNFGLNFSVLDGWWREGYDGKNGWVIGVEKDYPNDEIQDFEDANDFYKTMESTVVPLYYDNSDEWFKKTQVSFVTNIAKYSTRRMVMDYMTKLYSPAATYGHQMADSGLSFVRHYISKRKYLRDNWPTVTFNHPHFSGKVLPVKSKYDECKNAPSHHVEMAVDDTLPGRVFEVTGCEVSLPVYIGTMDASNVVCELVVTSSKNPREMEVVPFENLGKNDEGVCQYKAKYQTKDVHPKRMRIRVYPTFEGLAQKFELGYAQWY